MDRALRRPSALAARLCMAALHCGGPRAPRQRVVMMRAAAPRRTPAARRRPVTSRPRPTPHPPFPAATMRQQASERHVASRTRPPKNTINYQISSINSRYFWRFFSFQYHADAEHRFLGPCVASTISARGAPVHGGVALWRSSRAASTRRDDARCCAPPNASRAAPSRHQPAAPDATSALSSSNRPSASQRSPRGVSHVAPKNTMKLPNI